MILSSSALALATSSVFLSLPPSVHSASVSSTTAQTISGIGGSGAWWPLDIFNYPESARQNLSSLLFSQDGLGLTSYRWNLGGGGVNVSNPTRAPETPYISPGVYNWTADVQGRYFLQEASSYGVPSLTMFVNSAPAPLTSGNASCNGSFVNGTGAAYGTYLADVIEHWRNEGINISYISPMNEPDNNFGPSPCGQEGMEVDPNQRAEVISGLWSALEARNLTGSVGILADESSSISRASSEYSVWLPEVVDKVAYLVHHGYGFSTDAQYTSYTNETNTLYPGKTIWMSEVCCSLGEPDGTGAGWSGGNDPTITNALMFSSLVFQSLVLGGESHYDFWTLVSSGIGCSPLNNLTCTTTPNPDGWTDGLIYYDSDYATNGNYEFYLTKHFWTYKHFGNFVKTGSQRHLITGSDVTDKVLAVSDSTSYYVLAMNPNTTDSSLSLTFPENVCAVKGFRTSESEDFASISPATTNGATQWLLPLTAMSLTTYEFTRQAC